MKGCLVCRWQDRLSEGILTMRKGILRQEDTAGVALMNFFLPEGVCAVRSRDAGLYRYC